MLDSISHEKNRQAQNSLAKKKPEIPKCPNCGQGLTDVNLQLTCMNGECVNFMCVVYGIYQKEG